MSPIAPLLEVVTAWAASRGDIVGLALVGSWGRDAANPNSDIDLLFLIPDPDAFRVSSAWPTEIDWPKLGLSVESSRDAKYGVVWSRHVELSDGMLVRRANRRPAARCIVNARGRDSAIPIKPSR
jgi:hypothetical protein